MATYLYDNALLEKLKAWTADTDVHIYGVEDTKRLFEVLASENNDKPIQLPIICLRRKPGYKLLNFNKIPLTFNGMRLNVNDRMTETLNAIPIQLDYQLDIYCKHFEEADEYARNFVFNIINYPKLTILIPYHNAQFEHVGTLRVSTDIADNSDIPERLISGQFTRLTLDINIDDAYLWDVKDRINKSINDVFVTTND